MPPRRRDPPAPRGAANGQQRQQQQSRATRSRAAAAAAAAAAADTASVHSLEDSSPEPERKPEVATPKQRRTGLRTRSSSNLLKREEDGDTPTAEPRNNGRSRRIVLKGAKRNVPRDNAVIQLSSDEDERKHDQEGKKGGQAAETAANGLNGAPSYTAHPNDDLEHQLEEVDVTHADSNGGTDQQHDSPVSPGDTTFATAKEDSPGEEMELEQVDIHANEDTANDEAQDDDDEMDLEQVDVADGTGDDEDTGAYAAAYQAARANGEAGEDAQPIFKDGKGQPGGINISLSASAQRSSKVPSSASKRGNIITTRDRLTRLATHKLMTLTLLAHARVRNELLNDDRIRDDLYAIMPNGFLEKLRAIHPKKVPNQNERVRQFEVFLRELTRWWSQKFRLDPQLTALGALRQPDSDLLAGQFPRVGRRVDGWKVQSARQRQDQERETRKKEDERRKAREARSNGASSSKIGKGKARATSDGQKPSPQPPFPNITLFGPSNSTTPVYLSLAEPREATRTVDDLLARVHAMNGSREHSAQLFAALCRAMGIPSRLVVSIQVPSWSISASKVAATQGATQTPTKGGQLAKKRRTHHEESALRRQQQNAVRQRNGDSDYLTSEAETFHDSADGNTSDEFHGISAKFRRRATGANGTPAASSKASVKSSRPVSIASTTPGHSEAESIAESSTRRSTRRAAVVNGAKQAAAKAEAVPTDDGEALQSSKLGGKDGDYRGEKWRGLDKPLQVEYKPKLRMQKPKPLKASEVVADTQPDVPAVDTLAPPTMWVEVYSKPWQRWITVDPVRGMVEPTGNRQMEPAPSDKSNRLVYVVAFEEDGYARDVTARYTRTLHSRVSRMRPPPSKRNASAEPVDWWSRVVAAIHRPQKLDRDAAEDLELEGAASREPMPTSVGAFKDHPVYAIEKHLKRDEVIHPYRQAGTFQGMPVFLRSNVIGVKSARQWYNEGRVVKEGEEALKWVKSRGYTLANKRAEEEARQQGLDGLQEGLYALFQTALYEPPPVVDGRVPTNSFGNIDLFVDSMLPPGAAHIPFNGTVKIAKQLGVHYAEAITGFEFRKHRSMPRLSGIVVAEEHRDAVLEAFWASEHLQAERELQRRQDRLFKNWKKLLNALKIQERIQREYGASKKALAGDAGDTSEQDDQDTSSAKKGKQARGKKRGRPKKEEGEKDEDDELRAYKSLHAAGHDEDVEVEGDDGNGGGGFLFE